MSRRTKTPEWRAALSIVVIWTIALLLVGIFSPDVRRSAIGRALRELCPLSDAFALCPQRHDDLWLYFRGIWSAAIQWIIYPVVGLLLVAAFWRDVVDGVKAGARRYALWIKNG